MEDASEQVVVSLTSWLNRVNCRAGTHLRTSSLHALWPSLLRIGSDSYEPTKLLLGIKRPSRAHPASAAIQTVATMPHVCSASPRCCVPSLWPGPKKRQSAAKARACIKGNITFHGRQIFVVSSSRVPPACIRLDAVEHLVLTTCAFGLRQCNRYMPDVAGQYQFLDARSCTAG